MLASLGLFDTECCSVIIPSWGVSCETIDRGKQISWQQQIPPCLDVVPWLIATLESLEVCNFAGQAWLVTNQFLKSLETNRNLFQSTKISSTINNSKDLLTSIKNICQLSFFSECFLAVNFPTKLTPRFIQLPSRPSPGNKIRMERQNMIKLTMYTNTYRGGKL